MSGPSDTGPGTGPAARGAGPAGPGLSPGDQRALAAILMTVSLASLDTAIANTALPAIAAGLRAPPAASIWIVNAYQLAVVAALLPFAALGDAWGPRRVFLLGVATFTLASAGCALATTLPALTAARVLQGLGAAAVMSVNLALIRLFFPPQRLGRGVGLNALVVGVSFAAGPTIASLVLAVAPWPWLFGVNVPLGVVAYVLARRHVPQGRPSGHRFDGLTAALTAVCFASLAYALGAAGQRDPWPLVAGPLLLSAAAGAALLRRQRGHPAPMLPVDLMRRPLFALSALTSTASFTTQGIAFVALPFFFEHTLARDPVQTGFLMTPWTVLVALSAPVAGRLADRYPPGALGGAGLALLSAGMAAMALLPAAPSTLDIGWRMALCGIGFGLFQAPNLKALMASAPPERSAGASGVIAIARLLGQTLGAALVALCFGLAGEQPGPVWALALGAGSAAVAAVASTARLWAR